MIVLLRNSGAIFKEDNQFNAAHTNAYYNLAIQIVYFVFRPRKCLALQNLMQKPLHL